MGKTIFSEWKKNYEDQEWLRMYRDAEELLPDICNQLIEMGKKQIADKVSKAFIDERYQAVEQLITLSGLYDKNNYQQSSIYAPKGIEYKKTQATSIDYLLFKDFIDRLGKHPSKEGRSTMYFLQKNAAKKTAETAIATQVNLDDPYIPSTEVSVNRLN